MNAHGRKLPLADNLYWHFSFSLGLSRSMRKVYTWEYHITEYHGTKWRDRVSK